MVEARFYVDGIYQATIPGISSLNTWVFLYHQTPITFGASPMQVDWVRAGAYPSFGRFTSCALDAGSNAIWQSANTLADVPIGTSFLVRTRTSQDGIDWSEWVEASGGIIASPAGRYLQYQLELSTSNELVSPEVQQISLVYESASILPTNTPALTLAPTETPAPQPTNTPTVTPVLTNTQAPSPTATSIPTQTPLPTQTSTIPPPTSTATQTVLPTSSPTPTQSALGMDDFNRADSSNLGMNWTERVGDLWITSQTLRNAGTATDNLATFNSANLSNMQASASMSFASAAGNTAIGVRLGLFSGGVPAAGYVAELDTSGRVILWRIDTWAQLGSYQITGYQYSQPTTISLRASGTLISVTVNGTTRISVSNSAFSSGVAGLWSYAPSAANQHIFDNFILNDLNQPTPTALPTSTATIAYTLTPLPTQTATNTLTIVPTSTSTQPTAPSATSLPTFTPTQAPTLIASNTPTMTVNPTATPTITATLPLPDTSTPTVTATWTSTAQYTPTSTNTPTQTSTPSLTPLATNTPTAQADLIFRDGFEVGTLTAWSSSVTDSGDLRVSTTAALGGSSFGMQAVLDDNVPIYVVDSTPSAEAQYRARFYFDPNTITMSNNNAHYILYGYSGTSLVVTRIEFRYSSGNYQLRAAILTDGRTWRTTNWFTIADATHTVEISWLASTAVGANNGSLTFWIDGQQRASLTGVDNDTHRIETVRLGALAGIDNGTRGIYFFDTFESRRFSYIGP